jgi:hypothetical protein
VSVAGGDVEERWSRIVIWTWAECGPAARDRGGRKRLAVRDVDDSIRVADPEQLLSGLGLGPSR